MRTGFNALHLDIHIKSRYIYQGGELLEPGLNPSRTHFGGNRSAGRPAKPRQQKRELMQSSFVDILSNPASQMLAAVVLGYKLGRGSVPGSRKVNRNAKGKRGSR